MFRNLKLSIVTFLLALMIVQPVSAYWCVGNLGFARPCLPIRPFRSAVVYRPVLYRPYAPIRVYYRPVVYRNACCPPVNYVVSPSCSSSDIGYSSGASYYLNECVSCDFVVSNGNWTANPAIVGAPPVVHSPMLESVISEHVIPKQAPLVNKIPGIGPAPVPAPNTFGTKKPLLPVAKEEPISASPKKVDPFEEAETNVPSKTGPAALSEKMPSDWEAAKPAAATTNPASVEPNSSTSKATTPSKPDATIFDDFDKPSTETVPAETVPAETAPSETAPSESIERPIEEPASNSSDVGDLFDSQPDTGTHAPNAIRDLEEKAKVPSTNPLFEKPKPQPSPFPTIRPIADPSDSTALKLKGGLESKALRTWNDNSGTFTIQGRLVRLLDGKVRILKANGRTTTVALRRLSRADLAFVNVQANAARAKYLASK